MPRRTLDVEILPQNPYSSGMPLTAYPQNLKDQVRFYQGQAEAWNEQHDQQRELEAILSLGLSLFDQIQKIDQEIANTIQAQRTAPSQDLVNEVSAVYQWWYQPCESLLQAIKRLKNEGVKIENAESFIRACQKARIPAFHLQEWIGKMSA
jgi:hypothetical protein